ncbi:TonB-dependent receptor [Sphingopyxis terrae]|uniref:Secretin and TonB N terminus short domain-containing protein n=1 Tax=Sphingopyxis terrae subsp. ummariensis TaxID=429001 RepID=A0A1Y6FVM6_9SPHN|nr:TonB-dependent receptor [Sphingopyxis terrae]PCF91414.1 TonB-dependent receptor [Sphingopyxis terrae subsp. ummariensis]SMQ76603.1 Secretin and TonB N terminus short domain-containing protein [Sphingopyxis terrae subsp. ummariensis]
MNRMNLAALLAAGSSIALGVPSAGAQIGEAGYDIAAQRLADALREYSRVSGRDVIAADELVAKRRSTAVHGRLAPDAALDRLLSGTGLIAERVDGALVLRERKDARLAHSAPSDAADAIIVTGTRIRGAGPVGSPVTTIDRPAIDRSGLTSVQQVVQSLPQNFGAGPNESTLGAGTRNGAGANGGYGSSINLKGLGASSTLVLIDGMRPALGGLGGVFADLSMIPLAAVDRIEVLGDGASAIYGADAVAGVVNLRLRNRFEGAETTLTSGTADGDMTNLLASQIVGHRWSGGHVVVAYQYEDRGRLAAAKRAFVTEDLRQFGGPDFRSTYGVPGTIYVGGLAYAIPAGQGGTALDPADLVPGAINYRDARAATDILPEQRTHSLYSAGEFFLTEGLTLRASLLATRRSYEKVALPESSTALTVPVSNPFCVDPDGSARPLSLRYSFVNDLGPEIDRGRVTGLSAAATVEREFGRWRLAIGGGYGRQVERRNDLNVPNRARIAQALADPDPVTALNLMGNGSANNPATIAYIRGGRVATTHFESRSAALRADGPLLTLPAGDIRVAIGAEYRREHYRARSLTDVSTLVPVENRNPELPGPRHVRSAYAEINVPLVGGETARAGLRRLDLSLAARIEDYSDVGTTTNPKFGLRWEPFDGVALRASYGTSFRAPSFEELIGPAVSLYLATPVADPTAPSGVANVLALFGYAPDIRPEKATTWTIGADVSPRALPELRGSITYYEVDYRDRIGTANEDFANFLNRRDIFGGLVEEPPSPESLAFYFGQPTFSNPLGLALDDISAILDGRIRNLSRIRQSGLDFDLGFAPNVAGGTLDIGVAGSRIFHINRELAVGAPTVDIVGTLASPSKWRLRGRLGWARGGFSASGFANYVGGYRNQLPTPAQRVGSWTTIDFQVAQRIGRADDRHVQLALSATNLFDSDPPYVANRTNTSALGYDPDKANAIGRMISLSAKFRW